MRRSSRKYQRGPGELSDDEKDGHIAASMGNPLNMSVTIRTRASAYLSWADGR